MAVAASLVLMAVFVPKILQQSPSGISDSLVVAQQRSPAVDNKENLVVAQQSLQIPEQRPQGRPVSRASRYLANQRFNDYLQAHSNSVYTIGASNYQPYARVTGYDQGR
nr:hypothetical protein [Methylomarinum sp. Ch1-1]MDP4519941.1 hypothetical protein [Methylomarinum sp. Ch1-1]